MDSGSHVVVDLSSDEEVDTKVVDRDYLDWLNVIETAEEKSDSVEVISEVNGGAVNSQYRKIDDEDDDDDCVILDCDPDKTTTKSSVADDYDDCKLTKDDDDDDEVLVVGQKGEIACRDFPHPRHSCAKYAFNTTSHDKYCDMCHCYVCDIPAPCQHWSIGVSSVDHCHANDKEQMWKNQREFFRTGLMPMSTTQPSPKPTTSTPLPVPASVTVTQQFSQPATQSIVRLSTNPLPQSQVGLQPCSSSGRLAVRARSRVKQLVAKSHNHGLQNRQTQSLGSVHNVIQKDRSSYRSNFRAQLASSGTRHGAANGRNIKVGLYTNAHVSQPIPHISSAVPPTITPRMYTQQQPNGTDHRSPGTGPQSNVYARRSGVNKSGSGNRQLQTNPGLLTPSEPPLTHVVSQAQTVQQQPGSNENVLQTKLVEFESWLMDSSNHVNPVTPLPELVSEALTFDFETFLND